MGGGGVSVTNDVRVLGNSPRALSRPQNLIEPIRELIRDELRKARLRDVGVKIVGVVDDEGLHPVMLFYNAEGRLVEAYSGGERYTLDYTEDEKQYMQRVTIEQPDGREVIWDLERDTQGRVVRAMPTVSKRVMDEVAL